jgi:Acyltransferase family
MSVPRKTAPEYVTLHVSLLQSKGGSVKAEVCGPTSSVARDVLRLGGINFHVSRLDCVDVLRGIVMVLMALDHVRDYFSAGGFSPEDLAHTSGPLFFTRFITHFCAPVFFLLAGTGGYLSLSRGKSLREISHFYWTRISDAIAATVLWSRLRFYLRDVGPHRRSALRSLQSLHGIQTPARELVVAAATCNERK